MENHIRLLTDSGVLNIVLVALYQFDFFFYPYNLLITGI